MRKVFAGNTLPEYVVIGSLVAIAGIAGLTVMGGGFNDLLQGLKSDLAGNTKAAMTASVKAQENAQKLAQANLEARAQTTMTNNTQLACQTRGDCQEQLLSSMDTTSTVQTTGGNGSDMTSANATVIANIANSYASLPNPSPEVLQALKDLSNAAYELSGEQRGLEIDMAKDGYAYTKSTGEKYAGSLIQANKKIRTAQLLLSRLKEKGGWLDRRMERYGYNPIPPDVQAHIDAANVQINESGDRYRAIALFAANSSNNELGQVGENYLRSIQKTDKWVMRDNSILKEAPQSSITNQNAGTICDAGDGQCRRVRLADDDDDS